MVTIPPFPSTLVYFRTKQSINEACHRYGADVHSICSFFFLGAHLGHVAQPPLQVGSHTPSRTWWKRCTASPGLARKVSCSFPLFILCQPNTGHRKETSQTLGGLVESRGARGLGAQMTAWSRVPAQPSLQRHKPEIHAVWVKPLQLGPVVTAVNIARLIRDIYTSDQPGEKNLRKVYRCAMSDET